jgi:hypothetical protein
MRLLCCLLLLLSGCASHAVRCDGHLHPINATLPVPASVLPGGAAKAPPRGTP